MNDKSLIINEGKFGKHILYSVTKFALHLIAHTLDSINLFFSFFMHEKSWRTNEHLSSWAGDATASNFTGTKRNEVHSLLTLAFLWKTIQIGVCLLWETSTESCSLSTILVIMKLLLFLWRSNFIKGLWNWSLFPLQRPVQQSSVQGNDLVFSIGFLQLIDELSFSFQVFSVFRDRRGFYSSCPGWWIRSPQWFWVSLRPNGHTKPDVAESVAWTLFLGTNLHKAWVAKNA